MISSLPDPQPSFDGQGILQQHSPWSIMDLIVFGVFSALTVVLLPTGIISVWHVFNPHLRLSDLTATEQVLIQGGMDLIVVGFIAFLVKVVHGLSFVQTIHWFKNYQFRKGFLIALGFTLAISVVVVSTYFPAKDAPPIEKLLSSNRDMWVFALFGVAVAPLLEEIIFRGFLFKVLEDIRGPRTAVTVTAVLFAALHILQLWGSWLGVALIFVVGFVMSVVRQRSNSIIPSFIIHTSYNGLLFGGFILSTVFQRVAH